MKMRAWHRVFLYGLTLTLLIGYMATKDPNLWSVFSHSLPSLLAFDFGNTIAAPKATS